MMVVDRITDLQVLSSGGDQKTWNWQLARLGDTMAAMTGESLDA